MSGLVGFFSLDVIEDKETLLHAMAEEITYVPEVHTDIWHDSYFGACRVHHGKINPEGQPVFNEDRTLCIFMEGEVFDYRESKKALASRGHRFRYKDNDAEYCLHLYEEYGNDAFERLNGSFIIVIYDLRRKKVVIANDRFSSRKVFYFCDGKKLLFGSQVRALLKYSGIPRRLDMNAVFEFFTFKNLIGDHTYFTHIKLLKPFHFIDFNGENTTIRQYWTLEYCQGNKSWKYYSDKLSYLLPKVVERQTKDDLNAGLLLSGGLDSRGIAAADKFNRIKHTFTVGNFFNREAENADAISKVRGYDHQFLLRSDNHYVDIFSDAVDTGDGMYSFNHAHFIGFYNEIRKRCDVVYHGFLLDMLFRGIGLPRKTFNILGRTVSTPYLVNLNKEDFVNQILEHNKNSNYERNPSNLFQKPLASQFDNSVRDMLHKYYNENSAVSKNIYDVFDRICYLFNAAATLNRVHIKYFIDERIIAYDNDLLDLYLEMPYYIRADETTWIRAINILNYSIARVPDSNRGFVPGTSQTYNFLMKILRGCFFEAGILHRPEKINPVHTNGSWPDFAEMIRHNDRLQNLIQVTINDPECLNPELFDIRHIRELFDNHLEGKENNRQVLFLLLTFGKWYEQYGVNDIQTDEAG